MHIDFGKLVQSLLGIPHLQLLQQSFEDQEAYIVGGAVRDGLLGRELTDVDIVCHDDPTPLAKKFAVATDSHWFWLDEGRRQSRVIAKPSSSDVSYDFSPFRAPTLNDDLSDRDFTMNAIAVKLKEVSSHDLIDPLNGLNHINAGVLTQASDKSLANDPLRIVKGVRHATALKLDIEHKTLESMNHNAENLEMVAVERIRQEFWSILADKNLARGLLLLHESGAGETLFGKTFCNKAEEISRYIPHYFQLWAQLSKTAPIVEKWLTEEIEQGMNMQVMLLFVVVLYQVESTCPEIIAEQWLLSRRAKRMISALVSLDVSVVETLDKVAFTPRALYWWAKSYKLSAKTLLLYLCCLNPPDENIIEAVSRWLLLAETADEGHVTDLVSGEWLHKHLGISKGPEMTRALGLLRNAEIFGEVSSTEAAQGFLCQIYLDKD